VGHVYNTSHEQRAIVTTTQTPGSTTDADSVNGAPLEPQMPNQECESDDDEDSELGFDNREDDWTDTEEHSEDGLSRVEDEDSDELVVAMDDMYGFTY
jgi:hypothetical protein